MGSIYTICHAYTSLLCMGSAKMWPKTIITSASRRHEGFTSRDHTTAELLEQLHRCTPPSTPHQPTHAEYLPKRKANVAAPISIEGEAEEEHDVEYYTENDTDVLRLQIVCFTTVLPNL